jgi:acetoin utilization deacetylase AcuC-like enzyme
MDFDVHHGNGTQHIFERDPTVLYISTHQYPYYPGTGAADEIGVGDGAGFTVNIPMESGSVDTDYQLVFDEIVIPVLRQFRPDLLIVSAGYDAHERDPLATMRATADGFGAMTMALRGVADEVCRGRLALVTEGGYDLQALGASLDETIKMLVGPKAAPRWPAGTVASKRGRSAADRVEEAIAPFWKVK